MASSRKRPLESFLSGCDIAQKNYRDSLKPQRLSKQKDIKTNVNTELRKKDQSLRIKLNGVLAGLGGGLRRYANDRFFA